MLVLQAPLAVMTDDSAAMKSALKSVWPTTRQLLCHFHVGQAEWRWLTSKVNNVPSNERQTLMKKFQKVNFCHFASSVRLNVDMDCF